MRRWALWIPIVMVASLLYWTVALGLGGLSLMAVSAVSNGARVLPPGADPALRDAYEPILVHLEESTEPEDVNDNAGCGLSSDDVAPAAQDVYVEQPDRPVGGTGDPAF